ncbi:receptor-like protein 36 isoform X2 [Trifolium pratense]|uniref:receptor-like protein 36 isoform X2 n=1 Tax=Trifolium pratense TaxID=57577 RepID=UPI001E690BF7|nr:receptor-like protein 36 isoform X2 [Trifolium pratense]
MERYYKFVVLFLVLIQIAQICLCANSNFPCIEQERQALLDFKASISYDSPNNLSSWKGTHCCQWEGIGCDNVTGHVVKLNLKNPCYHPFSWRQQREHSDEYMYNLGDDMPCSSWKHVVASNVSSSLLQLEHLTYLDLTGNYFSGSPIPVFIGSMGRLEYLSLSGASFSGRIPNNLGNLKNLQFLDLSFNYFDYYSPSPSAILVERELQMNGDISWISKLHSLKHLDLSYIRLNETHNLFQVLNTLPSLLYLSLFECEIDNSLIPRYALQNMTSLFYLDLSFNELHGPIPESFQNMTSMESLYLSDNNFTSIPSWFTGFEKLTLLELSFNGLHGPIPEVFRNMTSIESLYLLANSLTSIPPWLAELKRLVHLNLKLNQLTLKECFLSSIITNMCHLKQLDLSLNKLQGELMGHFELSGCNTYDLEVLDLEDNDISDRMPTWLGQLENLKRLNFGSNFFHGPIPLSIEKLSKLQEIYLFNNALEGVISSNIGQLVNLTYIDLSSNKLDGSIPQSLGKLENLQYLIFSNNSFNGLIPENLGQLVNLTYIDLSSNKFHGSIPKILGKLENLYYLDLSNNSFNGSIPESLGQLVNLNYLDISSNKLDGIMSMKDGWHLNLRHLNLSHNQITDSLPKNIGHVMLSLENLFLQNNHLNGSIPTSLCQCQLNNLDLSNNHLSGEIPNCWKDNQKWSEIKLSSNKLTGAFPSSFGNLSSLVWLHLNDNNLQGEFPASFINLTQLLILDLGENQLSGSIPLSWEANTFPSLQILRLRQNMLNGSIPSQLCQLKSLKILDLSRNKLQGSIPQCIGNLKGMTMEKSISSSAPIQAFALAPGSEWSDQVVTEVVKGVELEYTKILKLVVNMDLSQNNLIGFIPNEITWLTGLHFMNLSKNQLKGEIPQLIGDMKSLESLDMSQNQLSGTIPNTMSALTSLSHLNLSHNNLSGPIPKDNQFLTLDDPSIYAYNPYLCGSPLPNMCPGGISHGSSETKGDGDEDEKEKVLFYFVIAVGFATGLWGFIGTLWLKKNWRHAYFRWVEDVADKIYVAFVIKVPKIKKKMMRNHVH